MFNCISHTDAVLDYLFFQIFWRFMRILQKDDGLWIEVFLSCPRQCKWLHVSGSINCAINYLSKESDNSLLATKCFLCEICIFYRDTYNTVQPPFATTSRKRSHASHKRLVSHIPKYSNLSYAITSCKRNNTQNETHVWNCTPIF